jgi:hypothetical protein
VLNFLMLIHTNPLQSALWTKYTTQMLMSCKRFISLLLLIGVCFAHMDYAWFVYISSTADLALYAWTSLTNHGVQCSVILLWDFQTLNFYWFIILLCMYVGKQLCEKFNRVIWNLHLLNVYGWHWQGFSLFQIF